jgi:hypothetical protein
MSSPLGLEAGGKGANGIALALDEALCGDLEREGERVGELEEREERSEAFEAVRTSAGELLPVAVGPLTVEGERKSFKGL